MSNLIATLSVVSGNLQLINFPEKANKLEEFPDGRLLVIDSKGVRIDRLFIRVNAPSYAKRGDTAANIAVLEAYQRVYDWVTETYGKGSIVVGNSLERAISSVMYPKKFGSSGRVSTKIYGQVGKSSGSIIDMRLPRGIRLMAHAVKPGPVTIDVFARDPEPTGYLGKFVFAGTPYRFKIWHFNVFDWCDPVDLHGKGDINDRIGQAARDLKDHISPMDVVAEVKRHFYQAFPWAIQLDLLKDVQVDTHLQLVK